MVIYLGINSGGVEENVVAIEVYEAPLEDSREGLTED